MCASFSSFCKICKTLQVFASEVCKFLARFESLCKFLQVKCASFASEVCNVMQVLQVFANLLQVSASFGKSLQVFASEASKFLPQTSEVCADPKICTTMTDAFAYTRLDTKLMRDFLCFSRSRLRCRCLCVARKQWKIESCSFFGRRNERLAC
jgi:hypothetical protein